MGTPREGVSVVVTAGAVSITVGVVVATVRVVEVSVGVKVVVTVEAVEVSVGVTLVVTARAVSSMVGVMGEAIGGGVIIRSGAVDCGGAAFPLLLLIGLAPSPTE